MMTKSMDDVLGSFNPTNQETADNTKPLTIWIPEDHKKRYDALQKQKSPRKFCDILREIIIIAIEKTDSKAL